MIREHKNRIQGYLKPKQKALLDGFVRKNEVSQSAAINIIVKDYFSRIPQEQKIDFLTGQSSK